MTFEEYKEEILNGEKMEWYDTMVPRKLVTGRVRALANMIVDSLHITEGETSDMRNGTKEKIKRQHYIDGVWENVRHLPYSSNGLISDCYLMKYKKIIEESKKNKKKTKPKVEKTRKPKDSTTPKPKKVQSKVEEKNEPTIPVVKGRRGKNNDLIFGKNK